jgi:DNA replication regulator DPB11
VTEHKRHELTLVAAEREQITTMVQANGAEYHQDLTKKVTQLIVSEPHGNKYEYALNWKIKTVGKEWLLHCVERGMRLDEASYSPTKPPEERGKGAWTRSLPDSFIAQIKRLRDDSTTIHGPRPAKLRRTMSNRQKSDVQSMWAEMKAVATSSKPSQSKGAWEDHENAEDAPDAVQETKESRQANTTLRATGPQTIFSGLFVYAHGFNKEKVGMLSWIDLY